MMRDEFRAFEWLSTYRDSDGRDFPEGLLEQLVGQVGDRVLDQLVPPDPDHSLEPEKLGQR